MQRRKWGNDRKPDEKVQRDLWQWLRKEHTRRRIRIMKQRGFIAVRSRPENWGHDLNMNLDSGGPQECPKYHPTSHSTTVAGRHISSSTQTSLLRGSLDVVAIRAHLEEIWAIDWLALGSHERQWICRGRQDEIDSPARGWDGHERAWLTAGWGSNRSILLLCLFRARLWESEVWSRHSHIASAHRTTRNFIWSSTNLRSLQGWIGAKNRGFSRLSSS